MNAKNKNSRRIKNGFTLIGTLCAIVIILIAILGIFSFLIYMKRSTSHAGELFQADAVGHKILEIYMNGRGYDLLNDIPDTVYEEAMVINNETVKSVAFIYNINAEDIASNLKRLTLKLSWRLNSASGLGLNKTEITVYESRQE